MSTTRGDGLLVRRRRRGYREAGRCVLEPRLEPLESRLLLSSVIWSSGPALPAALGGISALPGPGIVVFGGNSRTVYQLPPGSFTWATAAPFDSNIISPGVGYIPGNTMLIFGGSPGSGATNQSFFYLPNNPNALDSAGGMTTSRKLLAYATDSSDLNYAIGGINNSGARLASAEVYNAQSNSWSAIASLPSNTARSGASAVYDGNGHILLFGGATNALAATTDVLEYTISTNTWSTLAAMPTATTEAAAVLGSDGNFYVLGGLDSSGNAQSTVQVYDPVANTWSAGTALPYSVSDEAAITDSLGRIDVLGGKNAAHAAIASVTVSQMLNQPNAAPSFTSTAPTQVAASGIYTYQVTTSGNPQASYSVTSGPAGMAIDPSSGLLTWTVPAGLSGTVNATIQASNAIGSNSQSFSLTLAAPTFTTTSLPNATANSSYSTTIATSANPTATYALVSGPAGLTISPAGTISWSPAASDIGLQPLTVQASNSVGATSQAFTLGVKGLPPGNVTAAGSSTTSVQVSWSAVSDAATYNVYRVTFTHSPRGSGGTYHYNLVASGITGTSYNVTGLPQSSISSSYEFVVTSVDTASGLQSAYSAPAYAQTWYAPDVYVFTMNGADWSGPVAATVGTPIPKVQFAWYASPNPVFTLVSGPAGMSIDPNTSVITWTPSPADAGTVTAVFNAANPVGSQTLSITFNVAPDLQVAPVMSWPALASPIALGTPWDATQMNAVVTDATTQAVVAGTTTYTAIVPNTTVSITLINPTSLGAGSWVVTATFVPTDTIHYTSVSQTQTLVVNQATSTTTLDRSSLSIPAGAPVTFTATVTPSSGFYPTGAVDFYDGTALLGSSYLDVNGQAQLSTDALAIGLHDITAVYEGDANVIGSSSIPLAQKISENSIVVSRQTFYGDSPLAQIDPSYAIAYDKTALLPGQAPSFANYTANGAGITGIMIDVLGSVGTLTAADFQFIVGNDGNPGGWTTAAPAPTSIVVLPGQGDGGANRIEITWAANAIKNEWLQVSVLADGNTHLAANDVFYFGNLAGDANGDGVVDFNDFAALSNNLGQGGYGATDFNYDGVTDSLDFGILSDNFGATLALDFTAPVPAAAPVVVAAVLAATPAAALASSVRGGSAVTLASAATITVDAGDTLALGPARAGSHVLEGGIADGLVSAPPTESGTRWLPGDGAASAGVTVRTHAMSGRLRGYTVGSTRPWREVSWMKGQEGSVTLLGE